MKRAWKVRLFSGLTFLVNLALWGLCLRLEWLEETALAVLIGGVALVYPLSALGRRALEADPSPKRAGFKTAVVHAAVMAVLGAAFIAALKLAALAPGAALPLPVWLTTGFLILSGLILSLTVADLALGGLGAPFAIASSRRLAKKRLYARTRNPMVLAVVLFLVALGLQLRCLWFAAWAAAWVFPAWWFFVGHFEERELEIRFGRKYRKYREATPMFLPTGPGGKT